MKAEEFGQKYITKDIIEIFDEACEFFSGEVPDDFCEEYDVEEILIEVRGQQEFEKNFDKILKFTDIVKNKQPELYHGIFQYFDDFLIDYYCFKQDSEQVKKAFSNFNDEPLQDFDSYSMQLRRLLFYQYTEILEQTVDKNYTVASHSDDLIDGAEVDLAFIKMYTTLQAVYESKGKNPDIATMLAELSNYGFEFKDNYGTFVETGLFKDPLDADNINVVFKEDKEKALLFIRVYFLRYMLSKGIQFYVSAKIIDRLSSYYNDANNSARTTDAFFKVKTKSFGEFIDGFSLDMFMPNESEVIATLWGSVHFYEFLYKNNFISQETFNSFFETSKVLKGRYIARYLPDLWKSCFIHTWAKPDCISDIEFAQEDSIFKKSADLKDEPFSELKNEISSELSEIGDLENYIIEGDEYIPDFDMSLLDKIFKPDYQEPQYLQEDTGAPFIREGKKIGRNDPCPCGSGKKYKKCCG